MTLSKESLEHILAILRESINADIAVASNYMNKETIPQTGTIFQKNILFRAHTTCGVVSEIIKELVIYQKPHSNTPQETI